MGERSGVTAGIDDRGALLVRDGERVERIVSGEVTWVKDTEDTKDTEAGR
jgi:biotin-(acetyl-CoA carboxylase) ligase